MLGIAIFVFRLSLSYEKLWTLNNDGSNLKFKSDLLNFLLILSVLIAFILFLRPDSFEYRWFFPLLPGMLVFTSQGIINFSEFVGEKLSNKKIISILIIMISLFGFYTQIIHADSIIKAKVNSYMQVKESGIWVKENSVSTDIIISSSIPQHSYYSERKVYSFGFDSSNLSEEYFNEKIKEIKPKYAIISAFEPVFTPAWAYEWPDKNKEIAVPVQVYFADAEKKQPILVVYELKY